MVGGGHGTELRRRGFRIRMQKYSCCSARRAAVWAVLYEAWMSRSSRCCRRLSCVLEWITAVE